MCGKSWLAIKVSLTHRPSSQDWALGCPSGSIIYVYFVLVSCTLSGLRLPFFLPSMHFLASVLCTCISMVYVYNMLGHGGPACVH